MTNAVGRWLIGSIGHGCSFEALAYIGPNDVRYTAHALGAIKAGYTTFFPSSRNSAAAHAQLLDELQCKTMITPTPCPGAAHTVLKQGGLRVLNIPAVEDLLQADTAPVLCGWNENVLDETPRGRRGQNHLITGRRLYSMLPPSHGAYLACHLMNAVPFETVMVAPIASSGIPWAAGLARALKQTNFNVAILAPSIIEELAQAPDLITYCAKRLECILYAGGDLPQHIGDHVAAKIPLQNQFGSTELGLVPLLMSQTPCKPSDWSYLEFHPDLGLEMRPVLAVDVYITDPGRWKWVARSDDILVLMNGEKVNPLSMEQQIMRHPQISGALVVGVHRLQLALLLEVNTEQAQFNPNAFTEEVWPRVEAANNNCPAYARITKSHILFTDPSAPMRRLGKSTIQRGATTELYKEEINRTYNDADTVRDCTLNIARELKHGLGIEELPTSLVYRHPTVNSLSQALIRRINEIELRTDPSYDGELLSKRRVTLNLYQDIIDHIPCPPLDRQTPTEHFVLLTQGTDSLGVYLLYEFPQSPAVRHVYCPAGISSECAAQIPEDRHHGLGTDLDARHLTFLQADLSRENMGLERNVLEELYQTVTLIVHNECLIVGSFYLGALPDSLGPRMSYIDWIPVDLLSRILVELCLNGKVVHRDTPVVHHPVNLQPSGWRFMLPIILEECRRASLSDIYVVPLNQWLDLVRLQEQLFTRDRNGHDEWNEFGDRLSRLTPFYQTVLGGQDDPAFPETSETTCRSALLSEVPGIQDEWIRKWMREWIRASRGIFKGISLPAGTLPNWLVSVYHVDKPRRFGIFELYCFKRNFHRYTPDGRIDCVDLDYHRWLAVIGAQCGYRNNDRVMCTVRYEGKDTDLEVHCSAQWITALRLMASTGCMKFRIESEVEEVIAELLTRRSAGVPRPLETEASSNLVPMKRGH
ncbi:NRPS-like enzyme [Aspergillus affinis]|uniref:NRPS-like enzyme n=1 Tax=Aspergillus affinis TaxID=1070780 RepID=UPI0022FE87B0|nr:NRPS-like enzyme [Aspergillus affinis]KAI9038982.1 NRPS-like enzyme [Aspergillus affinis]